MRYGRSLASILFGLLVSVAGEASAEPLVRLDLNKLEPRDGACRAYLVVENATDTAFTGFTLDLVIFDADGVIAKRLAVDSAPLPAAKTRVKLFDIQDLACDAISRILLNDVIDCRDASGERPDCVAQVELANRSSATFDK